MTRRINNFKDFKKMLKGVFYYKFYRFRESHLNDNFLKSFFERIISKCNVYNDDNGYPMVFLYLLNLFLTILFHYFLNNIKLI